MEALETAKIQGILEEITRRGNPRIASSIARGERVLVLDKANRLHLLSQRALVLLKTEFVPDAFGEPWGTFENDKWTPSLAAMVRVGASKPFRRIVISDTAAQHFLYSKGVHKPGILERDPSLRVGDEAWVADPTGAVLGRAKILQPTPKLADALRPLDDLGWYLREGG